LGKSYSCFSTTTQLGNVQLNQLIQLKLRNLPVPVGSAPMLDDVGVRPEYLLRQHIHHLAILDQVRNRVSIQKVFQLH